MQLHVGIGCNFEVILKLLFLELWYQKEILIMNSAQFLERWTFS